MLEHVNCNLCGSDDANVFLSGNLGESSRIPDVDAYTCTNSNFNQFRRIMKCTRCGLIYASPRPGEEELLSSYKAVVDQTYVAELDGRVLTFQRSFNELSELLSPRGRLLDIGCHIGMFLKVAQGNGWECYGLEPSRWATQYGREQLGVNIKLGTLGNGAFERESFDAVTMWDVIEHLTDPLNQLREIWRILKPEGLLCLTTLDIGSPFARLMGRRWWWLMEMHLYYFARRTITAMLGEAGFETVCISRHTRLVKFPYLVSRLEHYSNCLARIGASMGNRLGLTNKVVPVNFGDLMTVFARKRGGSNGQPAVGALRQGGRKEYTQKRDVR